MVPAEVRVRGPGGERVIDALVVDGFRERLVGLMGDFPSGVCPVLAFPACRSLHTAAMGSPVDMAFVGPDGAVALSRRAVPPWRAVSCPGAAWALERVTADAPWPGEGDDVRLCVQTGREAPRDRRGS
ncbi:hypothetical protein [Granulimonas faecalis]|uniref:hypothetical protein n=1 Tax=Granulimonas faecalis TaxID=2894155 RepID=UPI003514D954